MEDGDVHEILLMYILPQTETGVKTTLLRHYGSFPPFPQEISGVDISAWLSLYFTFAAFIKTGYNLLTECIKLKDRAIGKNGAAMTILKIHIVDH